MAFVSDNSMRFRLLLSRKSEPIGREGCCVVRVTSQRVGLAWEQGTN